MNNKSCDRWLKRLFFPFLACPFHFYLKMCVLTLVNNNWVTSRTFSKPRYDISLHCTAPTLTPFSSSTNNSKSLTDKNDNQWLKTELEEFFSHWTATILITSNLTKRLSKSWQILTKEKLGKSWLAPSGRSLAISRACDWLHVFVHWTSPRLRPATCVSFQFGLVHWTFPRLATGYSYLPLVLLGWLDNPRIRDIFIILKLYTVQ